MHVGQASFRKATASVCEPLVDEGQVVGRQHDLLGVLDQPVVLGVEDVVDGGQADVLVGAAVAGDEMRVEQFVVVFGVAVAGIGQADGRCRRRRSCRSAPPRARCRRGRRGRCGWRSDRRGDRRSRESPETTISSAVFGMPSSADAGDDLRDSRSAPGMNLPYGSVGAAARCRRRCRSARCRASSLACALTSPQVAMPPLRALDQLAGRDRIAGRVELVLTQEHLVRGMRGVGLVLVDERRSWC